VLNPDPPTVLSTDLAVQPPTLDMVPPLILDEPVSELPVVNDYAWNTWASANSRAALLVWLAALYVLALLGLPVAVLVFGHWRDGGVVWARIVGLLLLGYAVWLPTSLELWHYDLWSVAGGALLVLALNVGVLAWVGQKNAELNTESQQPEGEDQEPEAGNQQPEAEKRGWRVTFAGALRRGLAVVGTRLREHWRGILVSEGLFLAAFLLFTLIRSFNPDLWHPEWGGEKPMESGFLNAMLRSPVMPPYDPFFSGGYINYYYYGIYLVSLPIKATGIAPALAYNLVVPTIFALTLAGGYAVVAHLTGRVRYGLVGAAFLALLGNLAAVVPAGSSSGIAPVVEALSSGNIADVGARLGTWYIGPSRVIPYTINEFPFWTFLYADLHPHMIALPVVVLTIALAYQYVQRSSEQAAPLAAPARNALLYALTALALGTLAVTNSWDFPTYALLMVATLAGIAWRSVQHGIPWAAMVRALLLAGALALGGLVLYTPFFDYFHAMVSGIDLVSSGTYIGEYILLYGLYLAVLVPVLFGVLWRLLRLESLKRREISAARYIPLAACVLLPLLLLLLAWWQPVAGLSAWLGTLLATSFVLYAQRRLSPTLWFALLLALLAWAVSLGTELIFVRDHLAGTEYERMNTVFKFGSQVWTLLALAAAASLPTLLDGLGRFGQRVKIGRRAAQAAGLTALAVLVGMAAVFPLAGTVNRIANRFPVSSGPTLDGLAFLREARFTYNCDYSGYCQPGDTMLEIDLSPDAEAIDWLKDNLVGTPVVVQSGLWFYRAYGVRVAANTGFPTVSSELHANEQRDPTRVAIRNQDVRRLFSITDIETTLRLLAEYNVDYIYVGPIERAFYPEAGLQKFADMTDTYLDVVYDTPGVNIYQVRDIPPVYAQPAPFPFAEEAPPDREPPPASTAEEEEEDILPPDDKPAPARPPAPEPPGDVPPELQELEERVAANPSDGPLAYGLAERYRELNRLQDAARVLELAGEANPADVGLHHLWGDVLAQSGRWDEAAQVYQAIAEEVPTAGNWNKLATNLIQWGEFEQAETALLQAISLDATEPEPHFRLGEVYYYQGELDKAENELERYLELAPDGYLAAQAQRFLNDLRR
jgi:YYY domain-containing protein